MSFEKAILSFTNAFKSIVVGSLANAAKQELADAMQISEKHLAKMSNEELIALVDLLTIIRTHAARRDSPEVIHAVERAIGRELIELDKSPHSHSSGDSEKYQSFFDPQFFL